MNQIEFYKHKLQEEDIDKAVSVMKSLFLTTGNITAKVEQKLSSYTKLDNAVLLNSCTAALHLSLLACGIGNGDEVITCPMTFIATATAIMHTGAKPVFVDCENDTGLLNPELVEEAITERTKAIIPIHLYGAMADMKALRVIADKYGLILIEDAAHCLEGERDGVRPGELGDAVCYSFYATKNLTCGEGGALVSNNHHIAKTVNQLRTHGMSKEAADRYKGNYKHWDMVMLGWKYNPSDILSALLLNQIDRIDSQWGQRQELWKQYDKSLAKFKWINKPQAVGKSACHLYTIWVDPDLRDALLQHLQNNMIGVAVNYRAIHTLSYFRQTLGYKPEDFPAAKRIGDSTISLPFHLFLNNNDIENIMHVLDAFQI